MPYERLGMRSWLESQIESKKYRGVKWLDRNNGTFVVPWKHASRHGWNKEDAALFKAWAVYTGRFREDLDEPNPKTWKANFRCAVNALPDIKIVKGRGQIKGKNAYRVFEFSKKRRSRVKVCQRSVGLKLENIKKEEMKVEEEDNVHKEVNREINLARIKKLHEIKQEEIDFSANNNNNSNKVGHNTTSVQDHDYLSQLKAKEIKVERDDTKFEMKTNERKFPYSLFEILQNITPLPCNRNSIFKPKTPTYYNSKTTSFLSEKLDDDVFDRLITSVTSDTYESKIKSEFDSCYNDFLYHAQSADSTSDTSDVEDIAEIFDDAKSYRSHSSASLSDEELEDLLMPREQEEQAYQPMKYEHSKVLPISSINAPLIPNTTTVLSSSYNPFFGVSQQKNDMIIALKQLLTQELA